MSYPEQQMQNFIEAGISEADRCYTRIAELEREKAELLVYVHDAEKWFNNHDPHGYVSPKREAAKKHLNQIKAETLIAEAMLWPEDKYTECSHVRESILESAKHIQQEGE